MQVIELDIKSIQIDDSNPKKASRDQIDLYKKILNRFGMVVPIVITSTNKVLFDNAKYKAAVELGFTKARVVQIDDLTDDELRTLRLAELNAQSKGEWDFELLFQELKKLDEESLLLTGFNLAEIENELELAENPDDIEEIEIPEVREDYFSQPGDIYLLGKHRLMCGDSTNPDDVKKLMNGVKADLMITDPPYNIDYSGSDGQKIKNDNMSSDKFFEFLLAFYKNAFENMRIGAAYYIFHADSETISFRKALEDAGFKFSQCLIWVKNGFNLSRQDYNWRHEPCLYGWKQGTAHFYIQDYTQDTVLENQENLKKKSKQELVNMVLDLQSKLEEKSTILRENKPLKNDIHPTMKPLKLLGRLMANSSKPEWNVLDLFGGSGSTLITAEQLGRQSFLMEFDPKYTDVIVRRFASINQNIELIRGDNKYTWKEIKNNFEDVICE
ncbi:DNA modification methylase [Fusobacterium hominis]|uniref:Methyltransferase n=1 Tax=Fusobacterium hominis TaxID=2764326 RepID=A0A7G9GXH0_9FUSO|nr:DNA modification methylase [Fusobacterium hominis]QNM15502.1 DNA modification methylase [Fusobacterium hominis]